MKPTQMISRAPFTAISFLVALACAGQAHAERVVGQVTAADLARNVIDIDRVRYSVPAAVLQRSTTVDTDKLARSLAPGQVVLFEVVGGEIRSIQPMQGEIDLPPRSRTSPASGSAPSLR